MHQQRAPWMFVAVYLLLLHEGRFCCCDTTIPGTKMAITVSLQGMRIPGNASRKPAQHALCLAYPQCFLSSLPLFFTSQTCQSVLGSRHSAT
jgi:hypothetical protein